MMRLIISISLLLASTVFSALAVAESGSLLKDDVLRARPFGDAEIIANLNAQDKVEVSLRKGAWANIQTPAGKSGWIRVLNIRTGSGKKAGDSGIGAIASLFKTGSSGNTVSTGVKGLSEEQLKNAQPNPEEARRLNSYKNSEAEARRFAKQGKLSAQQVDYLPANNGSN